MFNKSNLHSFWLIAGVVLAVVTLAKHASWFTSDIGLCCLLGLFLIFGHSRWKLLHRQEAPEKRGNLKKIKSTDFAKIKTHISNHLVGHGPGILTILKTLKRNMALIGEQKHLGSFLLVGPTGTGKTLFAELLADALYGDESFIKIAMNQDGMRGESIIEILLKAMKKNPYRVVLLDEIDKAREDIQASLYNFLESGQIMDPQTGEWYHCPGLVIIATTNAGSESGFETQSTDRSYELLEHVASHSSMKKALLARFEGLFWFGELSPEEIVKIGIMQVTGYYNQFGIQVNYVCPEAIIEIMKENFRFKGFGVRQMIQVVRHKSDPIIAAARANGWEEVQITFDQNGTIKPHGMTKKRAVA